MLQSLTSFKDALEDPDAERRQKIEEEVDKILDRGDEDALIEKHMFALDENDYVETVAADDPASHTYTTNRKINPYAFQFFGGYVARKARQFSAAKNCEACFKTLVRQSDEAPVETQYLIDKKSRGFLMKASAALYNFLVKLESTILTVINRKKIGRNILWEGTVLSYETQNCKINYLRLDCSITFLLWFQFLRNYTAVIFTVKLGVQSTNGKSQSRFFSGTATPA